MAHPPRNILPRKRWMAGTWARTRAVRVDGRGHLAACQQQADPETTASQQKQVSQTATAAETTTALGSGIDMSGFDPAVRAQDDLFSHVNGKWVAETEMPADKARWGTFDRLVENSQKDVRALVEEVSATSTVETTPTRFVATTDSLAACTTTSSSGSTSIRSNPWVVMTMVMPSIEKPSIIASMMRVADGSRAADGSSRVPTFTKLNKEPAPP